MPEASCDTVASLWNYAVALHTLPDMEAAMLPLQDEAGLDIPELLWMCWLERCAEHAIDMQALASIRTFRLRYTEPLRAMRRDLKALATQAPRLVPMRSAIKKAELESERESLHRLAEIERQPGAPSQTSWQQWHGELSSVHSDLIRKIRHQGRQINLE